MRKTLIISILTLLSVFSKAQVGLVSDCHYFFGLRPVMGTLSGISDLSHGVNTDQKLQSRAMLYGVDLENATWTYVEKSYLVPQIKVPIYVRYMKTGAEGLKLSDGTVMPQSGNPASSYFNVGMKFLYSPIYFKMGDFVLTPKMGFGFDIVKHDYNLDLNQFLGKAATNPDLVSQIASISPTAPLYESVFWGDVAGISTGAYMNIGDRLILELDWDYYPKMIINQDVANNIKNKYGINYAQTLYMKDVKLNRLSLEGRWYILNNVSVFLRYESADYQFETENGITTNGAVLLDRKNFVQRDYNLLFGLDVVFLQ